MSSREGQMHDEKGGGFGVGRRVWFPWPPTLLSPSLFLFRSQDEQRLIRWSRLSSFCAKNPTFSLLAWKTKEQVPCPTPKTSITEISVMRNPPPQAQTKPGVVAGRRSGTGEHPCPAAPLPAQSQGKGVVLIPRGLVPARQGEDLPTHNRIICIHFNVPFPSSTTWRDLSANNN